MSAPAANSRINITGHHRIEGGRLEGGSLLESLASVMLRLEPSDEYENEKAREAILAG